MNEEKKKLSLFNVVCLGIGSCVGAGIFIMMGTGIATTGRSISLVMAIGCFYMLLAYFYQVVMSSMFVFRGGTYDMSAMLLPPSLIGMNAVFTILQGVSFAMLGLSVVDYAAGVFPGILPYSKWIAVGIMTLFFAATIKGSKFVATLNEIMTIVLLVSLGLFIAIGLPKVGSDFFAKETFFSNGFVGFISAVGLMAFACQGSTSVIAQAAVTKNSKKMVPIAILIVTIIVAVVYTLIAVVASGVLPLDEVAGQSLAVVAKQIFPSWGYPIFVLGGACCALLTTLVGCIAMMRYPAQQVAEDGWLPEVFKKTTKGGYPWVIQLTYYLFSIIPIILGFSLDTLVSLITIPQMIINVYMNYSMFKFVKDHPEQWKKSVLHMPMGIFRILCGLSVVANLLVIYTLFMSQNLTSMIMIIAMVVICYAVGFIQLKRGVVKGEDLINKRAEILAAVSKQEQ